MASQQPLLLSCSCDHIQPSQRRLAVAHLIAVSAGASTVWKVVGCALSHRGDWPRHIDLRELLLARTDTTVADTDWVMRRMIDALPAGSPTAQMTLSWVLDRRSDGQRAWALAYALTYPSPPLHQRYFWTAPPAS